MCSGGLSGEDDEVRMKVEWRVRRGDHCEIVPAKVKLDSGVLPSHRYKQLAKRMPAMMTWYEGYKGRYCGMPYYNIYKCVFNENFSLYFFQSSYMSIALFAFKDMGSSKRKKSYIDCQYNIRKARIVISNILISYTTAMDIAIVIQ
ncbi:hypothetical protein PHYBLDRAFT_170070 [Phycomyces blakesleeanus NRRL 1555(-)]|uniref:Uncharacterized protein n=1 Tax=Phycomyces blakesleeanus (strain ATCC 8743b / DSM 1359 / FGSC 10004 / NBRC 33097 / NRRL 1555) TaxID=763407 RepID=A0A162U3Z2_PHYB8|nr:hypothetical protein PHYBLDRAFT_170070 [Phycomyces blakesleeanus NRRL 1555(-)]OAD72173.1 hypothetical protein PHYBLDRAFT_170070 [Phycomyces blakesleeanus NRRL 1555(-)]|eukprot:XP_018290213.1 hypothetical protein PHYBLDRAFT_170070 [Phycomyces blakesleeanus NRRL 1555(-)]